MGAQEESRGDGEKSPLERRTPRLVCATTALICCDAVVISAAPTAVEWADDGRSWIYNLHAYACCWVAAIRRGAILPDWTAIWVYDYHRV